jgi:hypothetical protein
VVLKGASSGGGRRVAKGAGTRIEGTRLKGRDGLGPEDEDEVAEAPQPRTVRPGARPMGLHEGNRPKGSGPPWRAATRGLEEPPLEEVVTSPRGPGARLRARATSPPAGKTAYPQTRQFQSTKEWVPTHLPIPGHQLSVSTSGFRAPRNREGGSNRASSWRVAEARRRHVTGTSHQTCG